MIALIILAFVLVFLGLVVSLVALYASEENEMKSYDTNRWEEPVREVATSPNIIARNFIAEEVYEDNGGSQLNAS